MKKFIYTFALFVMALSLRGQSFGHFTIDTTNRLKFGNAVLDMQVWNNDWTNAATKKDLKLSDAYPKIAKGKSYELSGYMLLNGAVKAEYTETMKFLGKDTCEVSITFKPPSDFKFRGVNMYITLPFREYKDGVYFDNSRFEFGQESVGRVSKSVKEAKFVGAKGIFRLVGDPVKFLMQDNRNYKSQSASLRLDLKKDAEGVYKTTFKLKFAPHIFENVDLSKISNSKLCAGNLPRGKVRFGALSYSLPSSDDCVEVPADGEIEIPLKSSRMGALYILSAFEGNEKLEGDVGKITPVGDGVGGECVVSANQVNRFGDDSVQSLWRCVTP